MVNRNIISGSRPERLFMAIAVMVTALSLSSCKNPGSKGSDMKISGNEYFADSAVSTVRLYKDAQGREILQKDNTYYDLVDFTDSNKIRKFMVRITRSETGFIDSAAPQGHFTVTVNDIADNKTGWKKEFPGTDVDYSSKVFIVHSEGRNPNEEDTYTLYSLLTGEKLMTYTYGQLSALIPNTSHKRFLGYLSKQSATDIRPEGFAVISYVGSNEVIDRVSVKLKTGAQKLPDYTPELKMLVAKESGNTLTNDGRSVILGHADKTFTSKDINDFAMQVNYYLPGANDAITILIPIREDHLDLTNATYDKAVFELSRIN